MELNNINFLWYMEITMVRAFLLDSWKTRSYFYKRRLLFTCFLFNNLIMPCF